MKKALVPLATLDLEAERDVVAARQRARQLAGLLGFAAQDQSRIATATSEICRNAVRYASRGRCEFSLEEGPRPSLVVRTVDEGPGIRNLEQVLAGRYQSDSGMGLGIVGTRRLMDRFTIESAPGRGTEVVFAKDLPPTVPAAARNPAAIAQQLARAAPPAVEDEVRQADHEVLRVIGELRARSQELEQIRGELEETNRGVVALYAELDQRAESLRKATELKSRFLSNMSHEFRTPLNAIQSLARLVLEGAEGPLTDGQRTALRLVHKSAVDLAEMVNDLLDLAKIEAGKITVRPAEFDVAQLLGSLRGVLRPLSQESPSVQLILDPSPDLPPLFTDEAKVTQIVRNFASNALKFTERGEVRVGVRQEAGGRVTFYVRDTGIGIAPADQERIFDEFTQVEGPHQKKVKGTGLGLPLSRKLAEMLGGELRVESALGRGSAFFLTIPLRYRAPESRERGDVLLALVEDAALIAQWERFLEGTRYRVVWVSSVEEARGAVVRRRPAAVLATPFVGGVTTRPFLAELRKDPATRDLPVLGYVRAAHEASLFSLAADVIVDSLAERHQLLEALSRAISPPRRVLLIAGDAKDELRAQLSDPRLELLEARDAAEGLRRAREERPRAVVLDGDADGLAEEALGLLREEPDTRDLPVLVRAARILDAAEKARLQAGGARVVEVQDLLRDEAARTLRAAVWEAGAANA
jgi:signal transduction histidine kinase/CheY-like chemotaxis protein